MEDRKMMTVASGFSPTSGKKHENQAPAELPEDHLRATEERYRLLFDLVPMAVYSCGMTGILQEYNRRAVELWGREPAPGDTDQRLGGVVSRRHVDGTTVPHDPSALAEVLSGKIPEVAGGEVQIDRNTEPGAWYAYRVRTFDWAGNVS